MENEEPEKQLTREKTATTVEVASTKVERTTSAAASTVTGRTAWDALVDMGSTLGRLTPWVIIVAGALYGVYKFTTLTQSAQQDANKKLNDTYDEISKMRTQQMENLKSMFDLNNIIEERAKRKAHDAEEAQKDAVEAQKRLEAANESAKKAEESAKKAESHTRYIEGQASKIAEGTNQKLEELKKKENELAGKADLIDQQGEHIRKLKGQLIELAKLVNSKDSLAASRADNILNEASIEAKSLLSEYGKAPSKDTARALNELIGSSAKTLETALTQGKGLGFAFWQKYTKNDKAPTTYFGVSRQTNNTAEWGIFISVEGPNPAEEKVSAVEVIDRFVSVAGRDPQDWNKRIAYNVYLRPTGELGIDPFTPNTGHWTIPETENDFKDKEHPDKEAKHETLSGSEQPMAFMSLQDFEKNTELYDAAKRSYRREFSSMIGMLENETHFDPKKIGDTAEMPADIVGAVVQLLAESHQESLKPGPINSAKMIAPGSGLTPEVYGRIAAMALMKDFKIESTQPADSSVASTKDQACVVVCGYSTFDEAPIKRHARLTFTREGSNGKWMLLNFENPVVLS